MQCGLAHREVLGAERGRAAALKRISQTGLRHKTAEQGAAPVDVEVPAHHCQGVAGPVYRCGEAGELGTVQRVEPARPRPVTVPVGHRMRVDDTRIRTYQPGHQRALQRGPQSHRAGNRYGDRSAQRLAADLPCENHGHGRPASILRTSVIRVNGLRQAMASQATTVQYRPNKRPTGATQPEASTWFVPVFRPALAPARQLSIRYA